MSRASTGLSSVDRRKFKPRQYAAQEGLCWICQQPFPLAEMTFDHYIPRSWGGSDGRNNLRLACLKCNGTRGDKDPIIASNNQEGLLKPAEPLAAPHPKFAALAARLKKDVP